MDTMTTNSDARTSRTPAPAPRAGQRSVVDLERGQAREVFRRLDYPLWRQTAHNPVLMLRNISQEQLIGRGQDERLPDDVRRARSRRSTRRAARATRGGSSTTPSDAGPHRVLLGGVRAASVAAHLRGRPRRARRRSLQGSERPRRSAHRRRVHVPAGLLPSERVARRLAAGILRAPELGQRADRAGDRPPTATPCIIPVPLGNRSVLVSVWRVRLGRVKLYPARHRSRRERARGIASCRRGCTAATAKRACSRRSSSASAACAR